MASDDGSGVHLLEYSLYVGDSTDKHDGGRVPANRDNVRCLNYKDATKMCYTRINILPVLCACSMQIRIICLSLP